MIALAGRATTGEQTKRLGIGILAASQIASELERAAWLVRRHDTSDRIVFLDALERFAAEIEH